MKERSPFRAQKVELEGHFKCDTKENYINGYERAWSGAENEEASAWAVLGCRVTREYWLCPVWGGGGTGSTQQSQQLLRMGAPS